MKATANGSRLVGLMPVLSCATCGSPEEPQRNRRGTAEEPWSIRHMENLRKPEENRLSVME